MAAEYKLSLHDAFWRTSLLIPLILMPVRNQRMGGGGGPSFTDRASMEARNRAREFLEKHFTIVREPLEVIGWQLGTETLKL